MDYTAIYFWFMLDWWGRVEELTSDFLEEKKLTAALQIDLEEKNKQNETFEKVYYGVLTFFSPQVISSIVVGILS